MVERELDWITNFIWNIADDVLRDIYVRGKYRDVILPMTVIRRLDAVLEPTKEKVRKMKEKLDRQGIHDQHAALCNAAGEAFYNTSKFTLRDLKSRPKLQQLRADFEDYLDGFSRNVQEILEKFRFRNQIPTLIEADILGSLIEKFLDVRINLSPKPLFDSEGKIRLKGLENYGMGTIFEELIRRFNEENNEEAGEHFTPRDVVKLMADLMFLPIVDQIKSGTYLVYDGACGTGGMLTVAEDRLAELARRYEKDVSVHLYGQEVNPEIYAITKADLLLKGEGTEAENMVYGSTISADGFPSNKFDFMLSNPPYGKSWKTDLERLGGKSGIKDARFIINYADDPEFSLMPRSSDGQLLFLVNMISKMKHDSPLGSRIAEVHNGSSLFTGDAGQGESNIRRWIIENDWLEAIIALPLSMFYNTNIATFIWVLSDRKERKRQGKIQLIDATEWFKPLRKNLGRKNCELSVDDHKLILETFLKFEQNKKSKIFLNNHFGYRKIIINRPLRLRVNLTLDVLKSFRENCRDRKEAFIAGIIDAVANKLGTGAITDFNLFYNAVNAEAERRNHKLASIHIKLIQNFLTEKDDSCQAVIKKIHEFEQIKADPTYGIFQLSIEGKSQLIEFESDPELQDTEHVPLDEPGGIEAFFEREIRPYVPEAWISADPPKVGYEISFTKYFYKPPKLRSMSEIKAEIEALEQESHDLLKNVFVKMQEEQ
jgi:type I restriction enzyme M protein